MNVWVTVHFLRTFHIGGPDANAEPTLRGPKAFWERKEISLL